MLEDEYYDLVDRLKILDFNVPHSGIKFKYGDYIVNSGTDINGLKIYTIRKFCDQIFDQLTLYINPDIGFSIRDCSLTYKDVIKFIDTVTYKGKLPKKRVFVPEGYLVELVKNSSQSCPICMENFEDTDQCSVYQCGHVAHKNCSKLYLKGSKCALCRM